MAEGLPASSRLATSMERLRSTNRKAILRAAHDEGGGAVLGDDDFVGLRE